MAEEKNEKELEDITESVPKSETAWEEHLRKHGHAGDPGFYLHASGSWEPDLGFGSYVDEAQDSNQQAALNEDDRRDEEWRVWAEKEASKRASRSRK